MNATDDATPVECPQCHYKTVWTPPDNFPSALDIFNVCPVITELLVANPGDRDKLGGNPRLCNYFRNEWVRARKAKSRQPPQD
jgi:hypothetical protein